MGDTEVRESSHCLICKYQGRRKQAEGGGGKELTDTFRSDGCTTKASNKLNLEGASRLETG